MITVTLSRKDIQLISYALHETAIARMRQAVKGRELAEFQRQVLTPTEVKLSLRNHINALEDEAATYLALKEGTFDKILKNTKEVEGE